MQDLWNNISQQFQPFILPVFFIFLGIFSAWVFKKWIIKRLEVLTGMTKWSADDVFLRTIKKYVSLWLVLGGFFLAIDTNAFPESITEPVNKLLLVIAVLSAAIAGANLVGLTVTNYSRRYGAEFYNLGILMIIIRGLIIGIAILMLLQTFGMKITPLLGALGVGSMAAGFALKDTLANFFAGIQILISKQIHVGNFIQVRSGLEGTISDITLRNTTLVDRNNNTIVVPNSELAAATIVNYSIPNPNLRVKVDCGVAYDSNLEEVEKIVLETAKDVLNMVPGAVKDFKPNMRFHTFNDSSIDFTVVMRAVDYGAQHRVRSEYIKLLKKRFDEKGIEIPFPIRTIIHNNSNN